MKILNMATVMAIVFTIGCALIAIFYNQFDLYLDQQFDVYFSILG